VDHYDAGSFKLSSQRFAWPKFPPEDDAMRTGEIVAAATIEGDAVTPIPLDRQLVGRQRLAMYFKCPPTLRGTTGLKFVILRLATLELP
jgi:hypothetical protein